ncbi:class I SAM-dependent methyltransferase [Mycoplasmatota bacterium WC44]
MLRIIPFVHKVIEEHIKPSSTVVDATCGNGNDTLFLSNLVTEGTIYAFDIQAKAIENTTNLVKSDNVNVIHDTHEDIKNYIKQVDLVLFNLGFLPNHDKSITTNYKSTLKAIENSLEILNKNGLLIIVLYPGHTEGKIESEKVLEFTSQLNNAYDVSKYEITNKINAPFVILVNKK